MKAFFLDRDGVIIEDENYLADPAKVRLCPGTPEAFKLMKNAGYSIYVVSNQSGVARGYFTMENVFAVQKQIEKLLLESGAPVPDGWYNCPHHPKGSVPEFSVACKCRKPEPGLILQAAKEHAADLAESAIVGDKLTDLESGFRAGIRKACLVRTGHGSEQVLTPLEYPYETAENLLDAVHKLLK